MARRAPLTATGEPRALTFNTSELLQTGGASPGWAWKRSGRRLTGTFGRPGGKLPSEHIEVEWDCREIGGHATMAAGGCGSWAAWKRCPKLAPNVPL